MADARGGKGIALKALADGTRIAAEPFRVWLVRELEYAKTMVRHERGSPYTILAERWGVSHNYLRDIVRGRSMTLSAAKVDEILTEEGIHWNEIYGSVNRMELHTPDRTRATRNKLPNERTSWTTRVEIQDMEIGSFDMYVTAGEYEDGTPAEVFVKLGAKSDTIQALVDCWAIGFSMLLQCGFDFEELVRKFALRKFAPSGKTDLPTLPITTSVIDCIVHVLAHRYGSVRLLAELQLERDDI